MSIEYGYTPCLRDDVHFICFVTVRKLHGTGSRKIIAFFLMRHNAVHCIDASNVVVNWKHHGREFVERSLKEIEDIGLESISGNEWLIPLILEYMVGDRQYIARAADFYRQCRLASADPRSSNSMIKPRPLFIN